MQTDTVTVTCRARECGAQYEQRVGTDTLGRDVRWSTPLYQATLPRQCGVCGATTIRVTDAPVARVRA